MQHRCWWLILGIWQHCDSISLRLTRFDKAHSLKKHKLSKKKTPLVVSLEGTLIPSILLPAHFMPCSALIDVKIGFQIREYQCVCLCVCPFAPHTCSFACVCVLLLCAFYYFILTPYRCSSVEPADLSCIWAPVQPEHITLMKGTEAFLMYAEHLNCMSLLLCSDLALEG